MHMGSVKLQQNLSSPEPKAEGSYCHIRGLQIFHIFIFFFITTEEIFTQEERKQVPSLCFWANMPTNMAAQTFSWLTYLFT